MQPYKSGRGRGRGRGAPPGGQEQSTPPGQQRPHSHRPLRGRGVRVSQHQQDAPPQRRESPPGFFTVPGPTEEAAHAEPKPAVAPPKQRSKMRTVHPEELGIEIKQESANSPVFPMRPGYGNLGRPIRLKSNCFPIKIPSGCVYHYDVKIFKKVICTRTEATGPLDNNKRNRCLNTKTNRKIIVLMLETNHHFNGLYAAYDGEKNLYTREKLEADFPLKCEVILPDENSNPDDPRGPRQDAYEVEINPVIKKEIDSCAINLGTIHDLFEKRTTTVPQEAIMAIETILRHGPCLRFTPLGHSFFWPPENLHPLGGGLEIWFGCHQSIRLGQWKPIVNIDIAATTFWREGPVLDYIAELLNITVETLRRLPRISEVDFRRISKKLRDKRIVVTHLNYPRKCCILELDRRNANDLVFPLIVNGIAVNETVANYFLERYNRVLNFPNLPCLRVYPRNKHIYYPIEVCNFTAGQHARKELTSAQQSRMISFTSDPPKERFQKIDEVLRTADFNNDRCVQEFDLEIAPEPLSVEGRVLNSPSLMYKHEDESEKKIRPRDGSWNLQRTQFLKGARIKDWVLLSFARIRDRYLNEFSEKFSEIGGNLGISIGRPSLIRTFNAGCNMEELLSDVKINADLAVVVLPTIGESDVYSKIKKASEIVAGLMTQCIKEATVKAVVDRRNGAQIISNLWLKVNAKMGGENTSVVPNESPAILRNYFERPVIVIGADVNHPGPSRGIKPSLAACVGTLNGNLSRYAVTIRPQMNKNVKKKSDDIIHDLESMVRELLKAFYHHTRQRKPEKIIFFRDGVSEGQFEAVRKHEVKSIREACRSLQEDYQPGITFIIVQKRHHVRFRPEDERDGVGNMKNIPSGTIIDTEVTHPVNFDFFLCSQFSFRGTSRPSHYFVLADDNDFTANDLQKLTFHLCHLSVRCTKVISIPAPVAYAHLAAYRARIHLEASTTDEDSSSIFSSYSSSSSTMLQQLKDAMQAIKIKDEFKSSMYFA